MKITQSFLKSYSTDACKHRVKLKYVDGIRLPFNPSNITARDKGHLFELLLLGDGTGDSDIRERWPKKKDGGMYAHEADVVKAAATAEELLKRNKVTIDPNNINKKRTFADIEGTEDARGWVNGEYGIIDVKYTETKADDRFSPFAWGDLDKVDYTQSKHYVTMDYLAFKQGKAPKRPNDTPDVLPFFFIVFGGKYNMWIKIIRVNVTPEAMKAHIMRINDAKEELKTEQWQPINDWNECHTCELAHLCDKKSDKVEVVHVEV